MPHVYSLRPVTVQTTLGHCIAVPANKPTFVPAGALTFAIMKGCVPCTKEGQILSEGEEQDLVAAAQVQRVLHKQQEIDPLNDEIDDERDSPPVPPAPEQPPTPEQPKPLADPPEDPAVRRQKIRDAVNNLIVLGRPEDFKKDGTPKAHPLNRAAGFQVDPLELLEVLGERSTG